MAQSTCSVPGCVRPRQARGWCHTHYEYWRRNGTTESIRPTEEERFWSKVEKTSGCWLWTGNTVRGTYGQFSIGSRKPYAHRYAYELLVGPVPYGLELDHLCRVKLCVRPDHLEAVTALVNNRRAIPYRPRKTHCPKGHPYVGDNITYPPPRRVLRCRACTLAYREQYKLRRGSAA